MARPDRADPVTETSYSDVVSSQAFLQDLSDLNTAIADSLKAAGEPVAINGNVCYLHMQEDFHLGPMSPRMDPKRRALHTAVQGITCFAEVGVAGGHAGLLALHSNPNLNYIGIDIGERLDPNWPPIDIYVPVVFDWLRKRFPDRVRLYKADAVGGLKQAVADAPFGPIGLLHLDAAKKTRIEEFNAAWPGLAPHSYLLQGDNKNGNVQASSAQLVAEHRARPLAATRFEAMKSANYDLLETGSDVAEGRVTLESLQNDRVLICVCHQDDETLFTGSLLHHLKGKADVKVVCYMRPGPRRADRFTREAVMQRICDSVGADYYQFPFAFEPGEPRLRRFITQPNHTGEPLAIRRPPQEHPAYNMFARATLSLLHAYQPSTIITHNHVGDYGHNEHAFLHYTVKDAAKRYGAARMLAFGHGLPDDDITLTIPALPDAKRPMFEAYLPHWDEIARYPFALDDERFVTVPL